MKMRAAAFAAVLACLLLGGCHGSRGLAEFSVPEEFDASREYEIVFWAKNDTNRAQVDIYEKAIEDFEALYPNIHVSMRLYTDYARIYNDVITNISTGTTPNVCVSYPDHIATYLTGRNTVVPLDGLFADGRYGLGGSELLYDSPSVSEMVPQYLGECEIGGEHFAIPYMRSTEACFVNRTYVEALGYELPEVLTWDFVWEVSEAAAAKDADGTFRLNGQNVLIPFIYKSTDNMMIQMLKQKGAGYSTSEGDILLFNDTAEQLLYEISSHAASGAFSTFRISGYPANFLNAGQCVFAVDSTAGSTWMGSDAPLRDIDSSKVVEFETAVRAVPQFDPQNPAMISQGPSICIFNRQDPQEVLASWIFAQFMLTDEVQIAYSCTEGYAPVTLKARANPAYADYLSGSAEGGEEPYRIKLDAVKLLLEHTDDTFVTPVFNGSASLRDAAGQMIENVCKSRRRGETVDEAYMQKLNSDISSLYRLDQARAFTKAGAGDGHMGPLPAMSKALLIALASVWAAIALYFLLLRRRPGK